jgi:hypothetical protein
MKDRLTRLLRGSRTVRTAPLPLSVREAWLAHERYAGRRVALVGVVRAFEAGTPSEYFTLDDGPNRVGLRGDVAAMRAQTGRRIQATGLLIFKPGDGIFLVAEDIQLTD